VRPTHLYTRPMPIQRWLVEPIEELTPSIGRQVVHTETMTIARIYLRAGAAVPRHEHPHEQVATVLEGSLRFVVGDEEHIVSAGESMFVPSGVPHEVEALADSLVLDVFSPVRDDWVRGDDAYLRGRSD
jgi:quercetin dioxygenase-like cupin family protein